MEEQENQWHIHKNDFKISLVIDEREITKLRCEMKKFALLLLVLGFVLMGCSDKRVSIPWKDGAFKQVLKKSGNQNLMVFFETDW